MSLYSVIIVGLIAAIVIVAGFISHTSNQVRDQRDLLASIEEQQQEEQTQLDRLETNWAIRTSPAFLEYLVEELLMKDNQPLSIREIYNRSAEVSLP